MQQIASDSECKAAGKLKRKEEHQAVEQLRAEWMQGMSFTKIACKYQVDPRTAKRYVVMNLSISELGRRSKSMLDAHRSVIDGWLREKDITVAQIHRRLNAQGVSCAYTTVHDYINKIRKGLI